ncbi:MAG: cysteine desulfurase [Cyclobacteriaceae bacterium]|nr:MAG: cysteine desulfurase [Cyclobacteriaceae bacterium]
MLDIDNIRRQFPIFSTTTKTPLVYLDNAATTQKPLVVLERLQRFYSYENANIHRGIYQLADDATRHFEKARSRVAQFINAKYPDEVVFCSGTTEAINMVAQGLRKYLSSDHQLVVTAMEHHANFVPWQTVCNQTGARLRVIAVKPDGTLDRDQLDAAIRQKPAVLALTHISNTLGTINPVHEIVALAKEHGVITVVDAAQSIAYDHLDVKDLDCDFLAFSGHKAFGPMGIGVLYGKEEQLARLEPYQQGGSMIIKVSEESTTFKPPPHGLEAGTPPVAEAVALGTALDFISGIGLSKIKVHNHSILLYAKEKLSSLQGVQQIGPENETSSIVSFLMKDIHPHDVATILGESGVAVRAGHHCAQPLMQALNIHGTVRASFTIYNNREDVDQLIDALKTVEKVML